MSRFPPPFTRARSASDHPPNAFPYPSSSLRHARAARAVQALKQRHEPALHPLACCHVNLGVHAARPSFPQSPISSSLLPDSPFPHRCFPSLLRPVPLTAPATVNLTNVTSTHRLTFRTRPTTTSTVLPTVLLLTSVQRLTLPNVITVAKPAP